MQSGGIDMIRHTLTLALTAALSLGIVAEANAASDCVGKFNMVADADGDGFCAEPATLIDLDGDGTANAADYIAVGIEFDCDDGHANMHPGATEVYGDGIDQDCDGSDATLPVSGPALDRFKATYGSSYTDAVFAEEYKRCDVAANGCTVDPISGTFNLDAGYVFEDLVIADGVTYGRDGIREVLTQHDWDNYKHLRGSASRGGIGSKKARTIAAEEADRAAEGVREDLALTDGRVDELESWQAGVDRDYERDSGNHSTIDGRFAAAEAEIDGLVEDLDGTEGEFDSLAERLDAQEESLRGTRRVADDAKSLAATANTTANANSETGVYAEIGLMGTGVFGAGLPNVDAETGEPTGSMARNPAGFGGGGEVRVGAQLPGARAGVFANMSVIGDGGDAPGNSIEAGFEGLGEIGDSGVYVGGFAAYMRHQTQVDALAVNAAEQGPIAGLSFFAEIPTNKRHLSTGVFARVGAGPSSLGYTGTTPDGMVVVDGVAVQGTIDLGLVIGGNSASVR